MRRPQYAMTPGIDDFTLGLRIGTPQHEHQAVTPGAQTPNHFIGKRFPAFGLVRAGPGHLHRQNGIEQQNALLRPRHQVAGAGPRHAEIAMEFLEDILKRWRERHAVRHRETQAMGLAWPVVGILADDDHPYRIEIGGIERGE